MEGNQQEVKNKKKKGHLDFKNQGLEFNKGLQKEQIVYLCNTNYLPPIDVIVVVIVETWLIIPANTKATADIADSDVIAVSTFITSIIMTKGGVVVIAIIVVFTVIL